MKTIDQIQKIKEESLTELRYLGNPPADHKKSQYMKIKKHIEFLTTIEMYLKTEPAEGFVQKEHDRLVNRLELIKKGQPTYPANEGAIPAWKKQVAKYNKIMEVSDIQLKLSTLKFILE